MPWPLWAALGSAVLVSAVLATAALWGLRRRSPPRAGVPDPSAPDSARDTLTGLLTRAGFESALEEAVHRVDHRAGPPIAVLSIGFDDFRTVNDGWGHRVGDAVLVEAAQRLSLLAGGPARVSRMGGAEFVLCVEAGESGACAAAESVLAALQEPFEPEGLQLRLNHSVGVALYPQHGAWSRLITHATQAMRSVRLGGGAGYARFDPSMAVDARGQAELLQDLRMAVKRQQLQLVYQPKIDARSMQVTAAKALLRWAHPRLGLVSPAQFVPLAERHGLMGEIGEWVIGQACRQAQIWREKGLRMRIAVNISAHQLRQEDFVPRMEAELARHGVAPSRLTCEITETVAMEDTAQTRAAFERLRQAGFHVSIDDFGTGHSSLAVLRRLPAAELKIDQAFVADLGKADDSDARFASNASSIVEAVIRIARTLGLRVVAEGVETEQQRDTLVRLGCDELQGYYFAKPMSAEALALWADGDTAQAAPAFRHSLFQLTQPAGLDP